MVERQFDAKRINEIVNHPSVLPFVKSDGASLDLSGLVADERNVVLTGAHGGVVFVLLQPGLYEAHTQVLPEGRGYATVAMVMDALDWMFCRTEAMEILTRCPLDNPPAESLAIAIGGQFQFMASLPSPANVYGMTIHKWASVAVGLESRGHWFHERLDGQITQPNHDDDHTHDRYVGATVEMVLGGQPEKAVQFYNRWACVSGYEPVALLSIDPITIDIRTAVLRISDGDFQVVKCQ